MSIETDAPKDTVWVEHVALIDRIPRWLAMLALALVVVGIWDLVTTRTGLVSPIILPSPQETWADLTFVIGNIFQGGHYFEALWTTTQTVFWAFLIAAGVGFLLGLLVGETAFGEKAVMPYLVAIDAMPKVAFAPLFIAWLGFGISSKVALGAFIATFPVVVATASGLYSSTENERMLFRTMGASRLQTLLRLKLPNGLPHIFTGLKIATVGVMAGVITGEFLGGGRGLGALIRQSASQMDTPRVFALILVLSVFGLGLYLLIVRLQKHLIFWIRYTD